MSVTISGLPVGVAPSLNDLLPMVQGSLTVRVSFGDLRSGLASKGINADITSITGLLVPLSISQGGTGANSQAGARTALGALGIGSYGIGGSSISEAGDLNALNLTEFFNTSGTTSNVPIGAGGAAGQGHGLHMQHPNPGYAAQYWTQLTSTRTFVRIKNANSYVSWQEFAFLNAPAFTGSLTCAGPVRVGQYTLTTLPSASQFSGHEIDVTNATGGSKRCRSNGSVWQILNTTTTVS